MLKVWRCFCPRAAETALYCTKDPWEPSCLARGNTSPLKPPNRFLIGEGLHLLIYSESSWPPFLGAAEDHRSHVPRQLIIRFCFIVPLFAFEQLHFPDQMWAVQRWKMFSITFVASTAHCSVWSRTWGFNRSLLNEWYPIVKVKLNVKFMSVSSRIHGNWKSLMLLRKRF